MTGRAEAAGRPVEETFSYKVTERLFSIACSLISAILGSLCLGWSISGGHNIGALVGGLLLGAGLAGFMVAARNLIDLAAQGDWL